MSVYLVCVIYFFSLFFFFSSRRRHTRLQGDWSSDVCSSDLDGRAARGWVRRLLQLTPTVTWRRIDGLQLLEAALCHDDARIDALAAAGGEGEGVDPRALRVLGQMAVLPLPRAAARLRGGSLPA